MHGGALRTDKVYPGGKLSMSGVYSGNTAQFGNDVNLFFLYQGSTFSYTPTLVCTIDLVIPWWIEQALTKGGWHTCTVGYEQQPEYGFKNDMLLYLTPHGAVVIFSAL
jgi:hypothetical protein